MALINTSVPNLIQGVSQQPDATRFDGQCEEQENALSSVAEGLKKRPNTRHVARLLQTAIDENSFVHFINRDDNEKYVVIHTGSGMEAWNIVSGVKCSMNGSTSPLTPPTYLQTSTPRESLKALTVADNTFIVNKEVIASISQTKTAPLAKKGFVYIAQGDYEKKYEVTVGGNISAATSSSTATFQVNVESYYSHSGWERFRVSGVTVINAGSGYPVGSPTTLNLNFNWGTIGQTAAKTTWADIYVNPQIDVTFSNGQVSSATVVNSGSFGQHDADVTGSSFSSNYNASITATVQGDTITGTDYVFSTVGNRNTVAADADTTNIATSLFDDSYATANFGTVPISTNPPFNGSSMTTSKEGNTIIIQHTGASGDFTLETSDGLGGAGIKAVYKRIDALSDLPTKAPNNFVVEVVGDADLDQDNYWVKFTTNSDSSFGEGAWEETVAPDISEGFNADSMPMTIRSTNLNTLEVVALDYIKRKAGDEETNPNPSFVGKSINDIVFFKNRLGFITDDSVVFSEAGEFFNFYRTTVSSLLDSAPIDITVSSTKVTNLKSATIFQENLMLFADNVQFVMKGGDVFTPKTVSVSPTTNFSLDDSVSPIPLGSYIYFPFTRGSYTGLRELALSANTETYDAVEVTEHVPAYIPSNIIGMAGTTSEDIIALLSANEKGSLYIYNYFWNNNQKVLSAWSKFTFTGEIRGIEFIDSTLYIIMTNNGQTHLLDMLLEAEPVKPSLYDPNAPLPESPVLTNPINDNYNPIPITELPTSGTDESRMYPQGYTLILYQDDYYKIYVNPETGVTVAFDSEGNTVGGGHVYTKPSIHRQLGERVPTWEEFEEDISQNGFTASYDTIKYDEILTGSGSTSLRTHTPTLVRGMGGVASTVTTTTLEFEIEEMTGEWELYLRGNSNYIIDSDLVSLSASDTSITIPPPEVACDRIEFRLKSTAGLGQGVPTNTELGSIKIKDLKITLTTPTSSHQIP
jgi:hypothetical protein